MRLSTLKNEAYTYWSLRYFNQHLRSFSRSLSSFFGSRMINSYVIFLKCSGFLQRLSNNIVFTFLLLIWAFIRGHIKILSLISKPPPPRWRHWRQRHFNHDQSSVVLIALFSSESCPYSFRYMLLNTRKEWLWAWLLLFEHSEVFIRCTRSRKTGCRAFKHNFDRYIGNFMAFVCHITVTISLKKLREVFKRVHDL